MPSIIVRDREIMGGEPVFRGTRIPFKILTDYLESGDTIYSFLDQYPSITRDMAVGAIEEARATLAAHLL